MRLLSSSNVEAEIKTPDSDSEQVNVDSHIQEFFEGMTAEKQRQGRVGDYYDIMSEAHTQLIGAISCDDYLWNSWIEFSL